MTLRDLTLEGLEQAINRLLDMDPAVCGQLAALHGRTVRIDLSGTGIALNFVVGHDGHLQLLGRIEDEPDATLAGSPFDLLRAGDKSQGAAQLFGGQVRIEGDTRVGQRFSQALADLDIDWEEQLSHITGDIPAHEIGRALRTLLGDARRVRQSAGDNLSEYLTEEARLLPHRFEIEHFLEDVDTLRDDVDRLEARIMLLEKPGKPGGEA
jgi:ubiquinone biosynthesis protein UbiJ